MNMLVVLSVLIGFSAVCYFLLGVRLIGGKREIGSLPLGFAFLVISLWVLGGAIELMASSFLVFSIYVSANFWARSTFSCHPDLRIGPCPGQNISTGRDLIF